MSQQVSRDRMLSKLMDLKKNCEFEQDYKNRKKELEEIWLSVCERLIPVLLELNENETESTGIRW
jgi:hypothetical protein